MAAMDSRDTPKPARDRRAGDADADADGAETGTPLALPMAEAAAAIGALQTRRPPRILHQYWDADPPRQIRTLLAHCRKVCRKAGIDWRLWDDGQARALLSDGFPAIVLEAYDSAPHPSMKSDVFRLAALLRHGGVYLDADMALRKGTGPDLWLSFTDALVFKWNVAPRVNAPNWCLGARAGHPMVQNALALVAQEMTAAVRRDPDKALQRALAFGPGALTRAVGGWLSAHGGAGVTVLDVQEAYRMVQNGPQLLGAPLDYKSTSRHWLRAAGRGRERP